MGCPPARPTPACRTRKTACTTYARMRRWASATTTPPPASPPASACSTPRTACITSACTRRWASATTTPRPASPDRSARYDLEAVRQRAPARAPAEGFQHARRDRVALGMTAAGAGQELELDRTWSRAERERPRRERRASRRQHDVRHMDQLGAAATGAAAWSFGMVKLGQLRRRWLGCGPVGLTAQKRRQRDHHEHDAEAGSTQNGGQRVCGQKHGALLPPYKSSISCLRNNAPSVTIFSPGAMPWRTRTWPSTSGPSSTARILNWLPSVATTTFVLWPSLKMARAGITSTLRQAAACRSILANISGLSRRPGLGTRQRTFTVRVCASTTSPTCPTLPGKPSPGYAGTRTDTSAPGCTSARSCSYTSASTHTSSRLLMVRSACA